jgi:hypothetical protein
MNIDWQMLALNIRRHKPLKLVSETLGKDKDYLGRLSRRAVEEPKFSDGLALLDMHLDMCGLEQHKKLIGGNYGR